VVEDDQLSALPERFVELAEEGGGADARHDDLDLHTRAGRQITIHAEARNAQVVQRTGGVVDPKSESLTGSTVRIHA
jgi:hypothetical protein